VRELRACLNRGVLDRVYAGPASGLFHPAIPLQKPIFSGFTVFQLKHNVAFVKHIW